jgi:hypothetical protein
MNAKTFTYVHLKLKLQIFFLLVSVQPRQGNSGCKDEEDTSSRASRTIQLTTAVQKKRSKECRVIYREK